VGNTYNAPFATHVNGDRITDLFQYVDAGALGFILLDRPGDYSSPDPTRWRPTDVNGDGRLDWIYVNYASPGVTVVTQITQPDGTRRVARQDVGTSGSAPQRLALAAPEAASTWFLADVGGGPADAPDGKADIVLIDDVSQQIVTLLSNGDGTWRKQVDPYLLFSLISELRGHASAAPFGDVGNWRAIDVNGDGKIDLVHIAFRQAADTQAQPAQAQIHVTTVPRLGNGHWGPAIHGDYSFNGKLRHPSIRGFFPADVDGDGRMDLVQVEASSSPPLDPGKNAVIFTLRSRSDGTWDDLYDTVTLPDQATASWRPMDVNGDGRTDLVSFRSKPGQPLLISYMLSLGNGRWQPVQNAPVSPQPIVDTFASQEFRIYDLDGDGKQDIVHLSKVGPGQLATMVIWNRFPNFVQTTTTGLAFTAGDTTSWQLADYLGADGEIELVRVQLRYGYLDVISLPARSLRMTRSSNGMGASEEIGYDTVVEADREMPLGALPHVVRWVGVRSVDTAARDATTQFSYKRATWSHRQRRFLGFRHVERFDGTRILSSDLDLGDECGARRATEELLDGQRRLIGLTRSVFSPTGFTLNRTASGDTHGHSLCRVDAVEREEWEQGATPRRSTAHMTHDDYGNVTELVQDGDPANQDDDRRFKTSVNFNVGDFIVNRPAEQEVYGRTGGQWNLLSQTRYEYDGSGDYTHLPGSVGDVSRVRRWNDKTDSYADVAYERDKQGNLRAVTGPRIPSSAGVTRTFGYDCEFARFPEKVCDPLHCGEVVWDKRLGLPGATVDANGGRTTFAYDPLRRPLSVNRPDKSFDRWRWPARAQWNTPAQSVRHERSDDSPGDGVVWDETFFDGLGRTLRVEREGGVVEEVMAYDGVSARVREQAAPRFTPDAREVTTYDYDVAGRLLATRRPDGSTRRIRYELGLSTATDELGATTGYEIDSFGRIVAVIEHRRDCFAENCPVKERGVTRYAYDALDRLTSITDARKHETRFSWDSLGRLGDTRDPDRGCTHFTWNDDGAQATELGANGTSHRMTYDAAGRLAVQEALDAAGNTTRSVRWTWDVDPALGSPSGASRGRITRVEDTSNAAGLLSTYHYDRLGRVDLESSCIDGACFELGTSFDRAGRIGKITYPNANGRVTPSSPTVDYVYDERGLLHSLPGFVKEFLHDARGRATEITYASGVVESRPHDPKRGWSNGVTVQGTNLPLEQVLQRDAIGRVRDERLTDSQGARHEVYTHDDLGRLSVVTSSDPARNRTFTYDILGNLTHHSVLGDVKYSDPHHVHAMTDTQSGESYTYDKGGQLLSSNQLTLDWSDEGRPVRITNQATGEASQYTYDVSGQRVKSEVGGKVTLYPHPLVQIGSGGAIIPWVWAEGRPLAYLEGAGARFLHADALGSVRLVTNSNRKVENEYDYGAWGEEARAAGTGGSAYRYAESRRDGPTGLAYMNARYYDPASTRFISADPIIPDIYAPQTLNRYAYALNDPVTLTDPTGLAPVCSTSTSSGAEPNGSWSKEVTYCGEGPTEQGWRAEQRAQAREEFRQSRELGGGPPRVQARTLNLKQYPNPTTFEKDWADFKASDLGRSLYGVWTLFATSEEVVAPFAIGAAALPAAASVAGFEAAGGIAVEELAAIEGESALAAENEAVTLANPRTLIFRQGPAEMTGSRIKRITENMKKNGFDPAQPIEIAEVNGQRIIIDGHHRTAAAIRAGINQVPIKITPVTPQQASQLAAEAAEAEAQRLLRLK
jgi:RHS repeat-associated protein